MEEEAMKKLVNKHRYDFKAVAQEMGISEEQARKRWTLIYCSQKNKKAEKIEIASPVKEKSQVQPKYSIEEISAEDLLTTSRKKVDFLDHSDVDFTLQKSISVTGEEITPSGYCVLKHSLKDTFHKMRERVKEFLPDIDGDDFDEDNGCLDFKVSMEGNEAVFQIKDTEDENWVHANPTVPLPSFDDIHVVPLEDQPKPRLSLTST